jgi:hypothetical protein
VEVIEETISNLRFKDDSKSSKDKSKQKDEDLYKSFTPNFLRPIPEIEDESICLDGLWLIPGVLPEPYWDFSLGNEITKVKHLLKKAAEVPLTTSQKDLIKRVLDHDTEAIIHYGFHSNKLSAVINFNKEIAIYFLQKLTSFENVSEYYNMFLKMEINLNSLEVFNAIVQSTQLPKEFILCYVKSCFNHC